LKDADEIVSSDEIRHLNPHDKQVHTTKSWLPEKSAAEILISAVASCPDAMVEAVISKISGLFPEARSISAA
jgi:4-hydroxy-3-methylbut-2-enyl diphosphate reductase